MSSPSHTVINIVEEAPAKQNTAAGTVLDRDDEQGNHNLAEDLQAALKTLLTHYGGTVDKMARRYEVVDARRQRFYYRGYQYIYFNWGQYVFLPVSQGQVMGAGSDSIQMPRYCAVYNIYKPYGRNFAAVLSQNPPGVNFEPRDPTASLDIKIAECAQRYSEHYDSVNESKKLQSKIARLFWTDGRVVARTYHEKNGQKFGTYQEQQDEKDYAEDVAQDLQAAALAESTEEGEAQDQSKPRGEEVTKLYGVIEAKCFPISADDQDELTGVLISDDPDVNAAKDAYDWIAEEIKAGESGTGESAFERNCRLGILQGTKVWQQSGDSHAHLAERQRLYLRPCAFNYRGLGDELRTRLKQIFPKGCHVLFVSGVYAESFNCSLDDEITVDHALDGDGMNRPSWGKDEVPVQDAFNSYRNYRQEMHDYGAPWTAVDDQLIDINSVREWISQPGDVKAVHNPNPATALKDYFHESTPATVPSDMIQAEQDLRDPLSQLITAVQPALFGGQIGAGKEDRVGVYQMAREQAMGVMSLPWGVIQSMFAHFKYQAVLAAARNRKAEETLNIKPRRKGSRRSKPISISIGDLQKGNFRAVPDTDSSFPSTRQMKKQAFVEFMSGAEANPMLAEAAMQPDNMVLGAELEGLPEIDIPAARAANRQRDEIDQLLETSPIPPTRQQVEAELLKRSLMLAATSAAQGQKAPGLPPDQQGPTEQQWANVDPETGFIASGAWMDNALMVSLAKCSLDVDEDDFHQYHLMTIKDWKNSEERDKQVDAGNRGGLLNLKLHQKQHEKFAAMEQQNQGQQKQPPKESMNFKDMPPQGQLQMAAQAGIQLDPQSVQPPPQAQPPQAMQ